MCYYRYYYFPSCKHQETNLVEYCDKALRAHANSPASETEDGRGENGLVPGGGSSRCNARGAQGFQSPWKRRRSNNKPDGRSRSDDRAYMYTTSFTDHAAQQQTSTSAAHSPLLPPASIGPAAIARELTSTSLTSIAQTAADFLSSPTRAAMAVQRLHVFHEWRNAGGIEIQADTSQATTQITSLTPARLARPYLREHVKQDDDLPYEYMNTTTVGCVYEAYDLDRMEVAQQSADQSQAVVEIPADTIDRQTSPLNLTTVQSSDTADTALEPGDFDTIEAEVDDLKRQIRRLRESEDNDRTILIPESTQQIYQDTSGQTKQPLDVPMTHDSAAERLQKQHEQLEHKAIDIQRTSPTVLPQADDFPSLGAGLAATSLAKVGAEHISSRGTTYAAAAMIIPTVDGPIRPIHSQDSVVHTETLSPIAFNTVYNLESAPESAEINSTEIPVDAKEDHGPKASGTQNQTTQQASLEGRNMMGSPHFARPTVATVRRADETLRRNSLSPRSATAETSPSKSSKGVTWKDSHRGWKRMALPSAWAHEPASPTRNSRDRPVDDAHGTELGSACYAAATFGTVHANESVTCGSPSKSGKKFNSYMSPTKATAHRAWITLGSLETKSVRPKQLALHDCTSKVDASSIGVSDIHNSLGGEKDSASAGNIFTLATNSPFGSLSNIDRKPAIIDRTSRTKKLADVATNTNPHFLAKENEISGSHSRIPRVSKFVPGRPRGSTSAAILKRAPLAIEGGLPLVANTTTRRRTSHADILQPILKRLDNEGLRKEVPRALVHRKVCDTASVDKVVSKVCEMLRNTSGVSHCPPSIESLPPHISAAATQSRQSSGASTTTNSTVIGISPSSLMPDVVSCSPASHAEPCSSLSGNTSATLHFQHALGKGLELSQTPTLRPTAEEFKPRCKLETPAQQIGPLPLEGSLDVYSPSEWAQMPDHVRKSMQLMQEWTHSQARPTNSTNHHAESPSKPARQQFKKGSMIYEPGDYHNVQAGQVLRPSMSPVTEHGHWTMRDLNGHERPVHFGRAAFPLSPPQHNSVHTRSPSISTTSLHTPTQMSPDVRSAAPSKTWSIGANPSLSPWSASYAWCGGDGKEIRFAGYGPHAEKNPNDPSSMEYYRRKGRFDRDTPDYKAGQKDVPKFWPRSKRQWAELAGASTQPCGDMHILSAIEQIPFAPALGWCNECTVNPF